MVDFDSRVGNLCLGGVLTNAEAKMVCHGDTDGQHQIIHSETFLCVALDDVLYHCITAWQSDLRLVGSTSDPCFCC